MLIAKIGTEHKTQIDNLEEEFNKEIELLNYNEKVLKEKLEEF